jgi:hypothetical protein
MCSRVRAGAVCKSQPCKSGLPCGCSDALKSLDKVPGWLAAVPALSPGNCAWVVLRAVIKAQGVGSSQQGSKQPLQALRPTRPS